MLVIRRRAGERLVIGEDIEIEILDARTNNVKLGITAPDTIAIVRKEAQLTRATNLTAAQSMGSSTVESALVRLLRSKVQPLDAYQKTRPEKVDE